MKRWTWKFEEGGGYDTLTSAVSILRNGREAFVLDRDRYRYPPDEGGTRDDRHSFPDEMRRDAEFIVDALNEKEAKEEINL